MSDKPFRLQPLVNDENEHVWLGGKEGELRFLACTACDTYIHPPAPVCPACLGRECEPRAVSGRAEVHTYTVNHHPWVPGFDPPYVVAIVEMVEQEGLRLMTNIVNCEIEDVEIGMPVKVCFEELPDGAFLPLFEPEARAAGGPE
jgi:uncharacterized OB-fold protein